MVARGQRLPLRNAPGGTPRARRPAPYRRNGKVYRPAPRHYRQYLSHLALLVIVAVGGLAGAQSVGEAVRTMPAVLLPPDVRYSAQLVLGIEPGPAAGGQAPLGAASLPEADATPTPEPVVEQLAFTTHEVAVGDTLTSIGVQYGVDSQYLLWNNPEVGADPDMLIPGETLVVPGTPGIVL